ncbi:MAG TPA: hypothetical protein VGI46_22010 [Candidatus Acidoferrum sp.]
MSGSSSLLQLGEALTPVPRQGEVLIQVSAVSLNFKDKAIVDGIYEPELVPCFRQDRHQGQGLDGRLRAWPHPDGKRLNPGKASLASTPQIV